MDEWLKIGNNSSGCDHYLYSYLIRGIEDEDREKIELFAPIPAVYDYCDVIHLMVQAPNVVQVSPKVLDPREPKGYDWAGEPKGYDWAGEPNPPITIECSGIEVDLSANYNTKSRIQESVRVQNFRGVYNMPVIAYGKESMWRLPLAYGVANMHTGNAAFSIGLDGTPSINLYEEESGDWLCNTKIHQNGKRYEGDIYMSKKPSPGKPMKSSSTTIKNNIDKLRLEP